MLLVLVIHFVSSVSSAPQTRYYRRSAQNTDPDVEVLEQIGQEAAAGESERLTTSRVQGADFSSAIAKVLAAANAEPSAISRGVSYGKRSAFRVGRSAQNAEEDVEVIDQAAVASSDNKEELRDAGFNAAIANVLAAAGAQPQAISRGVSYGKRSAQNAAEDEEVEIIDEAAVNANQESGNLRSAGFNAAIANVLAAAGAQPQAVSPGVSYGKRSAMDKNGDILFRADTEAMRAKRSLRSRRAPQDLAGPEHPAEADPEDPEAHPSGVPASVIAQVLKAAGAKPQPVVPGDISYLGKREAEAQGNIEAAEAVLAEIPLAAVKISPHSSHGNIVQHFDGDTGYQNSVHVSRFGRARRSNDFIPFHVYDARRVNTLKVEQNDFLALKARTAEEKETRAKRNHQQEKDSKNQK